MLRFTDDLDTVWESYPAIVAFMDLDGVLTDGTVIYNGYAISRSFNVQDGHWMNRASQEYPILPVIITSSPLTADIRQRVDVLKVPIFSTYAKSLDKIELAFVDEVLSSGLATAHLGDDINDHNLLLEVDYPFIPENATTGLLSKWEAVNFISVPRGGHGAVSTYMFTLIEFIVSGTV